jgi:hypothetical protein
MRKDEGNDILATKRITRRRNSVEMSSCFLRVDYILCCDDTLKKCVESILTNIHRNIPKAIRFNGYIKLPI